VKPEDITIAITVFDRRTYLEQTVSAALAQTLPVRVMVVEDCGPDADLRSFILSKFSSHLAYHRNPQRRGLFDNLNACLEHCATPWLCICPDDDFLAPCFVEAVMELEAKIPGKGFYYGAYNVVDHRGGLLRTCGQRPGETWQSTDAATMARLNQAMLPCILFRADYVKDLGGFRPTSLFTGDWDMWAKLTARYGAASTNRVIGNARAHDTAGRGTTRIERNGKFLALVNMQSKKNCALLLRQGVAVRYDRVAIQSIGDIRLTFLLRWGAEWSDRMLRYNTGLFLRSPYPGPLRLVFKCCTRFLGPGFVKFASRLYRLFTPANAAKQRKN
jgi:glycosyltransferase involved in cell wall biosynthesis